MGLGIGIRDLGSGKTYYGSGVKKAPDPGSATLVYLLILSISMLLDLDIRVLETDPHPDQPNYECRSVLQFLI
jgi:hypothetical protein